MLPAINQRAGVLLPPMCLLDENVYESGGERQFTMVKRVK